MREASRRSRSYSKLPHSLKRRGAAHENRAAHIQVHRASGLIKQEDLHSGGACTRLALLPARLTQITLKRARSFVARRDASLSVLAEYSTFSGQLRACKPSRSME